MSIKTPVLIALLLFFASAATWAENDSAEPMVIMTSTDGNLNEVTIDLAIPPEAGSGKGAYLQGTITPKSQIAQSCKSTDEDLTRNCRSAEFYVACNCYEEKIVTIVAPDGYERCKSSKSQWGNRGGVSLLEEGKYHVTARVHTSGKNPWTGGHQHGYIFATWIKEGVSESEKITYQCTTAGPIEDDHAVCGCLGVNTSAAVRNQIEDCYRKGGTRCGSIGYSPERESGVRYSVCVASKNYCQGSILSGACHVGIPHTDPVFYIKDSPTCP